MSVTVSPCRVTELFVSAPQGHLRLVALPVLILLVRMGFRLDILGYYPSQTPQTPASTSSATHTEHRPSGKLMRIPESSLSPEITRRADLPPMPPSWAFPPPAPPNSPEHSERPGNAGQCARLRALSTTLPTPDREIILLWAVAGVSTPDIAVTLGITPTVVRRAQRQALSALQPAATAISPPPATRQRVVLLPHVRNPPDNHREAPSHSNTPRPVDRYTGRAAWGNRCSDQHRPPGDR